jgi:5-methylcytosine-specific restriction endonuclease McrA
MKRCVHCDERKPLDAFPAMTVCRDGLSSWCRECHRAAAREHNRRTYVPHPRQPRTSQSKPVSIGSCRRCAASFTRTDGATGRSQRYCSGDCAREVRRERHRTEQRRPQARQPRLVMACPHCGISFVGVSFRDPNRQRFCSTTCGRRWHRDWNVYRRRTIGSTFRADRLTRQQIAKHTGWVCGVCTEAIDPAIVWPDPRSQSLDHINPVSRGGAHVRENLQLAHLSCNSRKSARVAA